MTNLEIINAIVIYNTLPSQIDYRLPQKIKSMEAEEKLETLSLEEKTKIENEIGKQINDYYSATIKGIDNNYYSPSEMNERF